MNRARHALIVERPQVLERPTAAGEDQYIALGACGSAAQGRDQLGHRGGALYGGWINEHSRAAVAARQHMQDVAQRRARRRGDQPDPSREARECALALGSEQPFGREPDLEPLELALQRTESGFLEMLNDQLVFTTRLVDAQPSTHQQLRPGARGKADQKVLGAEHGAAHLSVAILEREVPVAGGRLREIRELPLDPEHPHIALEQQPHLAVQARDAVNVPDGWGSDADLTA